jgi:hypothetical protein
MRIKKSSQHAQGVAICGRSPNAKGQGPELAEFVESIEFLEFVEFLE